MRLSPALLALPLCLGCPAAPLPEPAPTSAASPPTEPAILPRESFARDILRTDLVVDLPKRQGTARVSLTAGEAGASFAAGGLTIATVAGPDGPIAHRVENGVLHVAAPVTAVELTIDYAFTTADALPGATKDLTLTWPDACGMVFPCDPDPADGSRFSLRLTAEPGQTAIHPALVETDAPAYMLAWVVGDYQRADLGTTGAGTRVSVWAEPEHLAAARAGTRQLTAIFDWLERTYGPYAYGREVGSVAVAWGPGGLGGMEHHPYWHVAASAAADIGVHAHEAAHGWYGNGVRLACWEDFVLSEGTVTYVATRAIEQVLGEQEGRARWSRHEAEAADLRDVVAWPEGCGHIHVVESGLFGSAPYVKGALFFRDVARRVGAAELDAVLRDFYVARRGTAVRFQDLLDAIARATGWDPTPCAKWWLRAQGEGC